MTSDIVVLHAHTTYLPTHLPTCLLSVVENSSWWLDRFARPPTDVNLGRGTPQKPLLGGGTDGPVRPLHRDQPKRRPNLAACAK